MTLRDESAHLDRVLEGTARPETRTERFAVHITASPRRASMPAHLRVGSWERVLSATPPRNTSGISQVPTAYRHIDRRRRGIIPMSLPTPGVVLFGLMMSLVVALGSWVDDSGRSMTVAAGTTASPAPWTPAVTPVPTPALFEVAPDV